MRIRNKVAYDARYQRRGVQLSAKRRTRNSDIRIFHFYGWESFAPIGHGSMPDHAERAIPIGALFPRLTNG